MKVISKIVLCCLVSLSFSIRAGQEVDDHEQSICRRCSTYCAVASCLAVFSGAVLFLPDPWPPVYVQGTSPYNSSMGNHSMLNNSIKEPIPFNHSMANRSVFNSSIGKLKKD